MPNACLNSFIAREHPKPAELDLCLPYPSKNYPRINELSYDLIWNNIHRGFVWGRHHTHFTCRHIRLWADVCGCESWCINPVVLSPAECIMRGRRAAALCVWGWIMSHKFRLSSWRGKFGDRKKNNKGKPPIPLTSITLTCDDVYLSVGSCFWCGKRLWCYFSWKHT